MLQFGGPYKANNINSNSVHNILYCHIQVYKWSSLFINKSNQLRTNYPNCVVIFFFVDIRTMLYGYNTARLYWDDFSISVGWLPYCFLAFECFLWQRGALWSGISFCNRYTPREASKYWHLKYHWKTLFILYEYLKSCKRYIIKLR